MSEDQDIQDDGAVVTISEAPVSREPEEDATQAASEATAAAEDAQPEEKVARSTQKRIRDLLSERDHWKQEAMRAKEDQQKPAPKLEDFDHDIEQYTQAAVDHRSQEIAAESVVQQAAMVDERAARELEAQFNTVIAESVKQYPDFDTVFDKTVPVSVQMGEAILISEKPTEIAYFLGSNREVAAKIAGMPPHLQGYEIARLEARLSSAPIASKAPPPPTRSVAGTNATGAKSYEDMTDEEYNARRAVERAAYRARMY
jgi:hypothetical protein